VILFPAVRFGPVLIKPRHEELKVLRIGENTLLFKAFYEVLQIGEKEKK
jgi:hypothetical protein